MTGKDMNNYLIKIKLSNGDEVDARATASDQSEAIDKVTNNKEFIDFLGDATILSVDVQLEKEPQTDKDTSRFVFVESAEKKNWFVVTDTLTMFVIRFEKHRFNETRIITPLNDDRQCNALTVATSLREITDFLMKHHHELL